MGHHVGASVISLAPTFLQKSERAHSAAPPFQIEPAALGFNLVLGTDLEVVASILFRCSIKITTPFGVVIFMVTVENSNARGGKAVPAQFSAALRIYAAPAARPRRAAFCSNTEVFLGLHRPEGFPLIIIRCSLLNGLGFNTPISEA